jgi:hypothetical protein
MPKPDPEYSIDLVLHPESDTTYCHFENAANHPFQATPGDFPRVNVWWLTDAALLSYWDKSPAKEKFAKAGLKSEFIKEGSTDCYIAWHDKFVIVVFRGTEADEWDDMLTNSKIKLTKWIAGKVHLGFKQAIDAIWDKLEDHLEDLAKDRTVWFCGHSLGGALATLAAHRYENARGVCTIGCPRVGDADFVGAFNTKLASRTLRYVNHRDIITHVPPPALGYKHVEAERFIAEDGTISSRSPSRLDVFDELLEPEALLEYIEGLEKRRLRIAPKFLLEHMPKAYAIFTWNDYEKNG